MFSENVFIAVVNLFFNAALLQSWVPVSDFYFGFNGPSWFLSTLLFLTIITPVVGGIVRRVGNKKEIYLMVLLLACLILQIILACIADEGTSRYWLYVFPPSRIPDYLAGICLGFLFGKKQNGVLFQFWELFAMALYVVYLIVIPQMQKNFTWSAVLLPGALFTIWIFAENKSFISKLLSTKPMVYIGDNSFYYMMSHQVVLRWMGALNEHFLHVTPWMAVALSLLIVLLGKLVFDKYLIFAKRHIRLDNA